MTKVALQPLFWVDFEGLPRICKPLGVLHIKYFLPHAQKAACEQQLHGDYWAVESGAAAQVIVQLCVSTQGLAVSQRAQVICASHTPRLMPVWLLLNLYKTNYTAMLLFTVIGYLRLQG